MKKSGEKESPEDPNGIVLSYHDCLLRRSDVALLEGPHWLNDVLLGFYFEYLDKRINGNAEEEEEEKKKKELIFVSPELTQLLKMTEPAQYELFLNPVGASSGNFVFFPLNNCDSTDSAGGSHWSLLVYSKPDRLCYHFDSSRGFNGAIASEFARNVTSYFLGTSTECTEVSCPQQRNSYDCGIYVLCFTDAILDYIAERKKLAGCDCSGASRLLSGKRSELLSLIDRLRRTRELS